MIFFQINIKLNRFFNRLNINLNYKLFFTSIEVGFQNDKTPKTDLLKQLMVYTI